MKALRDCSSEPRFSILKLLQTQGPMTFSTIQKLVGEQYSKGKLSYYIKKLTNYSAIEIHRIDFTYRITRNGIQIVKTLESFAELHMTDQPEKVCINNDNGSHQLVTICRKCGYVPKLEQIASQK